MDVDRLRFIEKRIELWRQTKPFSIFENDKELTDDEYRLAIYAIFAKYRKSKAREIVKVSNARVLGYIKSPCTSKDTISPVNSVSSTIPQPTSVQKPVDQTNFITKSPCTSKDIIFPVNRSASSIPQPPSVQKPVGQTNFRCNIHLVFATKLPIFKKKYMPLPPIAPKSRKASAVLEKESNKKHRCLLPLPIKKDISMIARYKAHLVQKQQISKSAQRTMLPVLVKPNKKFIENYKTNLAQKAKGSQIPISQNMINLIKTSKQDALRSQKEKCNFIKKKINDCIAKKKNDSYLYFEIPFHDFNKQSKQDIPKQFFTTASKSASDSRGHSSRIPVKYQQKSPKSKSVLKLPGINDHKVRWCGNY